MNRSVKNLFTHILISLVFLLLLPTVVLADAIAPMTQFFVNPQTAIYNLIILVIIIVIEAILLKRYFRTISFARNLLYSFLINLASSIFGSLLFLSESVSYLFYSWISAFFLLFVITMIVEYPFVYLLYKKLADSKRCFRCALKMNGISYILCFILAIASTMVFMWRWDVRDKELEAERTHSEIMLQEKGRIYSIQEVEEEKEEHRYLCYYDVAEKRWVRSHSISDKAGLWDISGGRYACTLYDPEEIQILGIEDFQKIAAIPMKDDRKLHEIHFNHEGNILAVLDNPGKQVIGERKGRKSYIYGYKCRLVFYSCDDGSELSTHPEPLLSDVSWSSHGNEIVYVSYKDRSLFENTIVDPSSIHNPNDPDHLNPGDILIHNPDYHRRYIFTYDLATQETRMICEGAEPRWSPDGTAILFIRDYRVYLYSMQDQTAREVCFTEGSSCYEWSPSGGNIVGLIPSVHPLFAAHIRRLTVINLSSPEQRFIIEPDDKELFYWRPEFRWVE